MKSKTLAVVAIGLLFIAKSLIADAQQPPLSPAPQPLVPAVRLPMSAQNLVNRINVTRPPIRRNSNLTNVPGVPVPNAVSVGGGDSGGNHTNGPSLTGTVIE